MNQSTDQPIHRSTRRRNAFTLIELLVVVAILALLMAILAPSLRWTKLLTQRTQCLARQRTIGLALSNYASIHVDMYPVSWATIDGLGMFADAYGLRRDHPYSGATFRPALGLGLLVSTGLLPADALGQTIHCPCFDNTNGIYPGHCDDVRSAWAYGGSGWNKYPNHRILGSYNYRGTSYGAINGGSAPRGSLVTSDFLLVTDTPDMRFRGEKSLRNAHGGYNCVLADGSGFYLADPEFEIEELIMDVAGGNMDGRRSGQDMVYDIMVGMR